MLLCFEVCHYVFKCIISKESNRERTVKYEKELVLGKRSLNFVMPCWSEYDKSFPITKRTPCNGKGTLSKKSLVFVLPHSLEAFNQEKDPMC